MNQKRDGILIIVIRYLRCVCGRWTLTQGLFCVPLSILFSWIHPPFPRSHSKSKKVIMGEFLPLSFLPNWGCLESQRDYRMKTENKFATQTLCLPKTIKHNKDFWSCGWLLIAWVSCNFLGNKVKVVCHSSSRMFWVLLFFHSPGTFFFFAGLLSNR